MLLLVAPWFRSVREAQNALVSSFTETELELLVDYIEKATAMWEGERIK